MLRLRDFPCPKQHLILPNVKNYEALRKETSQCCYERMEVGNAYILLYSPSRNLVFKVQIAGNENLMVTDVPATPDVPALA